MAKRIGIALVILPLFVLSISATSAAPDHATEDALRAQLLKERHAHDVVSARHRREIRRVRAQNARLWAASRRGGISAPNDHLRSIAMCESGGRPTAISADGKYRGKYQFDYGTWRGVGGTGDPAAASEAEQDYRALLLYQRRGSAPWPVCQYR